MCNVTCHGVVAAADSVVRLATLELSIRLVEMMTMDGDGGVHLQDAHLAAVEGAREQATLQLRNFYKVWEKVCKHPRYSLSFAQYLFTCTTYGVH